MIDLKPRTLLFIIFWTVLFNHANSIYAFPISKKLQKWVEQKTGIESNIGKLKPTFQQIHLEQFQFGLQGANKQEVRPSNLKLYSLSYSAANAPLCNHENKVLELSDGSSFLIGSPLSINLDAFPDQVEWPLKEKVYTNALESLDLYDRKVASKVKKLLHSRRCWIISNDRPTPGFEMVIKPENYPSYLVQANQKHVVKIEMLAFDMAQGKIQAYEKNKFDSQLTTVEVEMTGNGFLESDKFLTLLDPKGISGEDTTRAQSSSNQFIFDPSNPQFAEASIFANAHRMLNYFEGFGYEWTEPAPMNLVVHAVLNGTSNNALYEPASATENGKPRISIGDGDSITLGNLATDTDVIAHEFGHHVMFRYLKTTTGESLILHEGLADYFVFAKTNDTCLGESICPESSRICTKPAQCLRSADVDMKYNDATYKTSGPHQRGQVVSATLWDMRDSIGADNVNSLMFNAIPFLTKSAGFEDLIVALLLSDKEYFESKYGCQILENFTARGFTEITKSLECNNESTWNSASSTTTRNQSEDEDDNLFSKCGFTLPNKPSGDHGPATPLGLLILILLPLALAQIFTSKRNKSKSLDSKKS